MNPEIPKTSPEVPKPPMSWHEAIRNYFPGNMLTPDMFISYEIYGDGLEFEVYSFSSEDPSFPFGEGIFIETNIPKEQKDNYQDFLQPVLSEFAKALSKSQDHLIQTCPIAYNNDTQALVIEIAPVSLDLKNK